jgi:hypothetical protein
MTKLVEMVAIAEQIPYIPPTNTNVDEWTNDEMLYESIHIGLVNSIQVRTALNMCNTYPPLKLIGKSILRKYIKHFIDLYNQSK